MLAVLVHSGATHAGCVLLAFSIHFGLTCAGMFQTIVRLVFFSSKILGLLVKSKFTISKKIDASGF